MTDLDLRSKSVIRNQKLHGNSRVVSIYSKGFYLISAGKDGKIVIYDYSKMEEVRTLDTSQSGTKGIKSLFLLEN